MDPVISLLFLKTRRLAPINRLCNVSCNRVAGEVCILLPKEDPQVQFCSRWSARGRLRPPPISKCLSFRSNFSSKYAKSSVHRHPLRRADCQIEDKHVGIMAYTDVQLVPVPKSGCFCKAHFIYWPFIIDRLNDEAKCWAHAVDILFHDSFNYCGLTGVIQPSSQSQQWHCWTRKAYLQHQNAHLLVFKSCFSQNW